MAIGRLSGALLVAATVAAIAASSAAAVPGDADPTFSKDGFTFERFDNDDAVGVNSLAVQDDGEIVAGITVQHGNGHNLAASLQYYLTRFNLDGSVDHGFGNHGIVELPGFDTLPYFPMRIALQSDDRIVVTKSNPTDSGVWVALYTTAGSPDPSFGGGDGVYSQSLPDESYAFGSGIAVLPDDRIVVGGTVVDETEGGGSQPIIVRLHVDGTPDSSFSDDGVMVGPETARLGGLSGVALDPAQRIVGTGWSTRTHSDAVVRYLPDGNLDSAFSGDGIAEVGSQVVGRATDLAVDLAGRPLIATHSGSVGPPKPSQIVRLTDAGEFDASFGVGGIATPPYPLTLLNGDAQSFSQLAVDAQGRPLIAARDYAVVTGRMTTTGEMDPTYSGDGWARSYIRRRLFNDGPVGDLSATSTSLVVGAMDVLTDRATLARLLLTEGPGNADGDSRPDAAERCPFVFGDCPKFERKARLDHRRNDTHPFQGSVLLRGGIECDRAPVVKLYRVRPGRDAVVVKLHQDGSSPFYRFELRHRRGSYYARVATTVFDTGICSSVRSNLVYLH